jgi:hypothetical protein
MRRVDDPVWRLRQLHDDWLLSDEQEAVLRRIDELDWLASGDDPVFEQLAEISGSRAVDDHVLEHARRIRADFFAAAAGPVGATVKASYLTLAWPNGATVQLSNKGHTIRVNGIVVTGPVEQVHERLEQRARHLGAEKYRPATAAERIERIRKLYENTCATTVEECSDDLEMFLADLSLVLES